MPVRLYDGAADFAERFARFVAAQRDILADVDLCHGGRNRSEDFLADQPIVVDDIGLPQELPSTNGEQTRIAGAGSHQVYLSTDPCSGRGFIEWRQAEEQLPGQLVERFPSFLDFSGAGRPQGFPARAEFRKSVSREVQEPGLEPVADCGCQGRTGAAAGDGNPQPPGIDGRRDQEVARRLVFGGIQQDTVLPGLPLDFPEEPAIADGQEGQFHVFQVAGTVGALFPSQPTRSGMCLDLLPDLGADDGQPGACLDQSLDPPPGDLTSADHQDRPVLDFEE